MSCRHTSDLGSESRRGVWTKTPLLGLMLVLLACSQQAYAVRLKLELITSTGFSKPVFAAGVSQDPGAIYVSEQNLVRIQRLNLETLERSTFLDLPNISGGQNGLQTFAFHPDYETNGRVYINRFDNVTRQVDILEFTRSQSDPLTLDPATQRTILTYSNSSASHNGGWLDFSPIDGMLYVLTGDGGAIPDAVLRGLPAQDTNDLRGKLLRIDVDGDDFPDDPSANYAIPANNPFAAGGGAPEVFAIGLRHPYTGRFDQLTGDLYVADVGSKISEEVNFLPADTDGGQNYGWRALEGTSDITWNSDPAPPDAIDPIYTYPNTSGAAIIAGIAYRGESIPGLDGTFIFGDYVKKTIRSFRYDGSMVSEVTDRTSELSNTLSGNFASGILFGSDADGELIVFDTGRGDIYRVVEDVLPGDFNRDEVVDLADYTVWRNTLGATGTGLLADSNGDLVVDIADYQLWKDNFGNSLAAPAVLSVPEPAPLGLLAIAGLIVVTRLTARF